MKDQFRLHVDPQKEHSAALSSANQELSVAVIRSDVTAIWCDLLATTSVDPDASFLTVGGDSIFAIHLAARVEERFGIDVTLMTVFECSTIAALAVEIERRLSWPLR
jgi:acyl carrier protein